MNRVRVKICGFTREQDVAQAVAAGVDAVGLVFVPLSKRHVSVEVARHLCAAVPPFISRVGLFLNQRRQDVQQVLDHVPLSLLQFHGDEDAEFCEQFDRPYIKAISAGSGFVRSQAEVKFSSAAGILVDSHQPGALGGTGKTLDWTGIGSGNLPLVLAGGLTPDNVMTAIRTVKPWAVDVSSGVETKTGIKDADAMKRFINEAKSEY